MLLVPTFLVRFYGTLLLGVSPGQRLCSLEVVGGGIRARLLGAVRVSSEIVGIPLFFIFQFPLVWGQKSWGERISGTHIVLKSQVSLPVQLLMVTTFIVISLLIPLLKYFTFSERLEVSFFRQGVRIAGSSGNVPVNNIYSSNRFRFQTRSILNEDRFILLPDFELIKIRNKKKIKPFLIIYDRHNKKVGRFKIAGQIALLSILEKGGWGNPLFRYHYPMISKLLAQDRKNYARVPYLEKYDGNPLIDVRTQKEIEVFMVDALNTDFSKMWIHLITKGPFARGYWEVRRDLMGLIQREVRPEIFLFSLGDQRFLRFRQVYSILENPLRDIYIPIGTGNAMIFRSVWEEGASEMEEIFLKEFFYSTKWYFDFDNIFSFPVDGNRLTPFHIMDYFTEQSIDEDQRKTLEDYLLKFCYLVSKKVVEEKDNKLEALLLDIFDRYRFIARTEHVGVRKEFVARLKLIQKALKLQDDEFFQRREM